MNKPAFDLGHCVMTQGIQELVERYNFSPQAFLERHHACDWSELCLEDQQANKNALTNGGRIFSKYTIQASDTESIDIFIITDACDDDNIRQSTCILLPEEY